MRSCRAHMANITFLKLNHLCLKVCISSLAQQIPLAVLHCSFLRKCLPNTQVRMTIACQTFYKVKMVFQEIFYKCQLVQLTTQTIAQGHLLEMSMSIERWWDLCKLSISSVRIIKWHVLNSWDLIKRHFFYCIMKDILK